MYAMVDREDDLKIGVKSSAILFADLDKFLIGVMQAMMLYALYLAGRDMHYSNWYFGGVVAAGVLFIVQQWFIRNRDPIGCMRAFIHNQYVGMVIFAGIALDHIYATAT
jgi:4-hydroxybenzoate polyprenyltransferase